MAETPVPDVFDTRAQIIKQALILFAERGYTGVSIRDIVEDVGITPGAIYHHFKGKQALYDTVVSHAFQAVEANLVQEADDGSDPRDRLRRALNRYARYMFANSPATRLVDRVIFEAGGGGPRLRPDHVVNGPRQALSALFRQINPDSPADALAEHAIASIYGAAKLRPVRAAFREGDLFADPADLAESLAQIVLRYLDTELNKCSSASQK
jgi:AcrR family transcriptional regulator